MKRIVFILLVLSNFLFASVGQITALVGEIKIIRDSKELLAKLGEKLEKSDVINSSKGSKAQITLDDNTIITIGQNSTLNIFDYAFDENNPTNSKADLGFMEGSFKSITGKIGKINKERFKLKTKSASIGIRGTTIVGNQRMIACTDGAISVRANGVTVFVQKQEITKTPEGQAPTPPEPLTPETLDTLEQESTGGTTQEEQKQEEKKEDKQDSTTNEETNDDNQTTNDGSQTNDDASTGNQNSNTEQNNDTTTNSNIDTNAVDNVTNVADDTTDNSNDDTKNEVITTETTTVSPSYTYTGNQITATYDPNVSVNSDSQSLEGSYSNNQLEILQLSDLISENYTDGTLSNMSFENSSTSSYSSYGDLSQTFTANNGNTYSLVSDNLGEFVMGYYGSADEQTDDFWYLGTETDMSNFDLTKIYVYKDLLSLELKYNNGETLTDIVKTSDNGSIYLNYLTKSLTYFDGKEYQNGASYVAGKLNLNESNEYDGTFTFSVNEKNEYSASTYYNQTGEVYGTIYGSKNQGFGYEGYSETLDENDYVVESSQFTGGGYLSSTYTNTETSSNNITLTGYTTKIFENISTGNTSLSLLINQYTGSITANVNGYTSFTGNVSDLTSYFIDNDLFGVSNSTNDFYMIALPDRVSVETDSYGENYDAIYMVDDESSWGYWTSYDDSINRYSTWVAGVETSTTYMSSLINASISEITEASYKGHVLGFVKDSGNSYIDPIKFDSSNYANFYFYFGGGTNNFSGSIGFTTQSGQNWATTISLGGSLTNTGFSNTGTISGTVDGAGSVTGSVDGKYYGTDKLNSIGGTFSLTSGSNIAEGVFKSTLDTQTTALGQ